VSSYIPTFTCPYCKQSIEAVVEDTGPFSMGQGSLGICPCAASVKAAEDHSRLAYEARKRTRRNK
jgi:copper chaperone CopZ